MAYVAQHTPSPCYPIGLLLELLLGHGCADERGDQTIELGSLFILGLAAALINDLHIDAFVHALKGFTGLRWDEAPFSAPDGQDGHLQTGKCLVNIEFKVTAEERG